MMITIFIEEVIVLYFLVGEDPDGWLKERFKSGSTGYFKNLKEEHN